MLPWATIFEPLRGSRISTPEGLKTQAQGNTLGHRVLALPDKNMRPLELVIRGFRSFAERVEIDWRDRRLVGIVGPIGSGKSSILDAVAFALYGKTPALSTESKTLIRHGAESARVELAFEADGETWRVIRVIRHIGGGRHMLYRDDGGPLANAVAEKALDVTARIEGLLGLDFSTFCQSVLLAQNRFAELLNASPGDRDKVLKGVFGFDRLDDMQALARARRADAELELKELEGRLASIADDEKRLADARRAAEVSAGRARRLGDAAPEVRELARREDEGRRRAEDAGRRRAELDELARQLPSAGEVEELAGAAERAAAELARGEEAAGQARDALAAAERERDAIVGEVGTAEDLARAESRLEGLRQAESRLARRRERQAGLERERDARRAEADAARTSHDAARQTVEQAQAEAERTATALGRTREELAALESELGGPEALARARETLQKLRLARADVDREGRGHRRAEERVREIEQELERAAAERDRAAQAEHEAAAAQELAAATVARAEDDLHRAEHAEMALTLAGSLEAGQPCPVCGQKVRVVQARLPSSESQAHARKALEAARAAGRDAGAEHLELSRRAAAARQAVAGAERALATARGERDESARRCAEQETRRREIEAILADVLGEGDPEARLEAAEERLEAAGERLRAREADERRAGENLRESRHALELAGQRRTAAESALETVDGQLAEAASEIRDADAAVAAARAGLENLLGAGDPGELLGRARSRLAAVDEKVAAARAAEREAAARVDAARRRLEASRLAQERLAARLTGLAGQLGHVLDAAAETPAPRRLSRLVRERLAAAQDAAANAVDEGTRDAVAARDARGAIHVRLELDAGADFDAALAAAREAHTRDAAAVEDLEQRLARAAELQAERRGIEARHGLYAQLADDLTASKFLRYLLEQERAALADLGSERFELLTESRYRFTTDGTFQVIDQFNAGAVRKPGTLSGGETFLASLALALALAEKVTAGGGRLDAFFLDEGFGSLDPEHLTLAMEGIERLVTESPNRLVTVVSHVPEMRERIEDLIELDKDPLTGSTIVRQGLRRVASL